MSTIYREIEIRCYQGKAIFKLKDRISCTRQAPGLSYFIALLISARQSDWNIWSKQQMCESKHGTWWYSIKYYKQGLTISSIDIHISDWSNKWFIFLYIPWQCGVYQFELDLMYREMKVQPFMRYINISWNYLKISKILQLYHLNNALISTISVLFKKYTP